MALLDRATPKGFIRFAVRLPVGLYRARLGWLLGERFLLLEHVGRTSGLKRRTVLEIVDHDPERGTYYVASGWGARSQWFQNLQQHPDVSVTIGLRRHAARAVRLNVEDAANTFYRYATHHPRAFKQLTQFMLGRTLGVDRAQCKELAEQVPVVALAPISAGSSSPAPAAPPKE